MRSATPVPGNRKRGFTNFAASLLLTMATTYAAANPENGTVVRGDASIDVGPGVVNIDQASDKAIILWKSFSIGKNEQVHFRQPGADSVGGALGADPALQGSAPHDRALPP